MSSFVLVGNQESQETILRFESKQDLLSCLPLKKFGDLHIVFIKYGDFLVFICLFNLFGLVNSLGEFFLMV